MLGHCFIYVPCLCVGRLGVLRKTRSLMKAVQILLWERAAHHRYTAGCGDWCCSYTVSVELVVQKCQCEGTPSTSCMQVM